MAFIEIGMVIIVGLLCYIIALLRTSCLNQIKQAKAIYEYYKKLAPKEPL